jgi:hypothetical protein
MKTLWYSIIGYDSTMVCINSYNPIKTIVSSHCGVSQLSFSSSYTISIGGMFKMTMIKDGLGIVIPLL